MRFPFMRARHNLIGICDLRHNVLNLNKNHLYGKLTHIQNAYDAIRSKIVPKCIVYVHDTSEIFYRCISKYLYFCRETADTLLYVSSRVGGRGRTLIPTAHRASVIRTRLSWCYAYIFLVCLARMPVDESCVVWLIIRTPTIVGYTRHR